MLQLQLRDGHLLYIMLLTPGFVTLPVLRLQWTLLLLRLQRTLLVSQTCYTACVMNVLHCSCDRRVMLLAPCYALLCDAPELVDHAIASCPLVDHKTQQKIQKQILWSPSPQINQHQVPHIAIVSCTGACGDLVIGNQPIGDQEFVRLLWCFVLKSFR